MNNLLAMQYMECDIIDVYLNDLLETGNG